MTDAKDYLGSVSTKFPDGLALQCIPVDHELWEIENYEKFLQSRRKKLADDLNAFLDGITDTKPPMAPITLDEPIAKGKSEELEFKLSIRWDFKGGTVNEMLEEEIVKTIAAFSNREGGTLLIGVNDDGEVLGLEGDYHTLGGVNRDEFEQLLRNVLIKYFGIDFVTANIRISFPEVGEFEICQLDLQ